MSKAHVITVNDGVSARTREDESGRALVRILKDAGFEVTEPVVVPDEQQRIAQAYIAQLGQAGIYAGPIVTRVDPLKGFFAAEAYHQDFLIGHPNSPYIVINDLPKVANLKRLFPDAWREQPVTVAATQ